MARLRAYLHELREGVRLLPEVLRIVFSADYWASVIQRYADGMYAARHLDEWAAWAEDMKGKTEGSDRG